MLVSLIALGLMHLKYWRAIVAPIVVTLVTYIVITGPVFSALDVNPAQSIESLSIPHQQIGYILNDENGTLTDQQAAELDYYMPVDAWKEAYHPFLSDHIKFHPELDRDRLADDIPGYIGTWAGIVGNNFGLAVEGYLYQTSIVWQIHEPNRAYTAAFASQVMDNPHGLEMSPLSERVHHGLMDYLTFTDEQLLELIWRPALFILLILLATSAGVIKNGVRFLLISTPVILNWGTMLAAIPAQDFRYMLPNVFILFVIALLAFGKFKLENKHEDLH
ncbi:DUF6020 family protein [Geomicrobium sp. JCM 19055]|uniref:DUF6020 family protein n=1 Tax=Geomicrobium sp. JCM 19055 TaxID=1460649 RepID=UPI002235B183|nr:DUF6020 family protein [Geomicrobium sp. JCM 19055]